MATKTSLMRITCQSCGWSRLGCLEGEDSVEWPHQGANACPHCDSAELERRIEPRIEEALQEARPLELLDECS